MDTRGDLKLALLVRGQFPSGDFAMFTGPGSVTYGGVTYTGGGQFLQIGPAAASAGEEKGGLTITLSGTSPEVISIAETEEFQRRRVTVYLAIFGPDGAILDADIFFDGLADTIETNDDPAAPSVSLACEQRGLDLGRPRPFRYLPEDQKSRFTDDTFFDLVQIIQTREPTWGK